MRRSSQIIQAVKENEQGKVDDICRELEVNKATLYNWLFFIFFCHIGDVFYMATYGRRY